MADDGMLLNFDFDNVPINTKASFKGGRWKDRLIAKRAARYQASKATSNRAIFNENSHKIGPEEYIGPEATSRPAKRQRVNDDFKPTSGRNATPASMISGKLPS